MPRECWSDCSGLQSLRCFLDRARCPPRWGATLRSFFALEGGSFVVVDQGPVLSHALSDQTDPLRPCVRGQEETWERERGALQLLGRLLRLRTAGVVLVGRSIARGVAARNYRLWLWLGDSVICWRR